MFSFLMFSGQSAAGPGAEEAATQIGLPKTASLPAASVRCSIRRARKERNSRDRPLSPPSRPLRNSSASSKVSSDSLVGSSQSLKTSQ
jgi:hypothetical protein